LIRGSSSDAIGWRLKKRSWPLCAATSAAARVSSSVLLMCSTLTWTSFFSPHCLTHVFSNQSSSAGTKWTHWMIERSPLRCRFLNFIGPANENGAAAPDTPTAAAPIPAFFSSSRLVSLLSDIDPPFVRLAERSTCEPGDESVEERVVDQRQWNARDQDRGHDHRPVEEVAANQIGRHADGESPVLRTRDERDRVDELVDDEREREDEDGEDAGDRDGKHDAHECAET